ncbi:MAG: hypothetical protein KatS3mg105_5081 [Gemmatales bacterium]|nr:MAG: hypothetical protein KatS3mg105_5081 [Gemmatales bacterium]
MLSETNSDGRFDIGDGVIQNGGNINRLTFFQQSYVFCFDAQLNLDSLLSDDFDNGRASRNNLARLCVDLVDDALETS